MLKWIKSIFKPKPYRVIDLWQPDMPEDDSFTVEMKPKYYRDSKGRFASKAPYQPAMYDNKSVNYYDCTPSSSEPKDED